MAQITISDELYHHIQQYAQETGRTQEEVVQEALQEFIEETNIPSANPVDLPPYDSPEERQLLSDIAESVGKRLATDGISASEIVIQDRGA